MAYQQKEGQGSLFKNDKQNDRQPDFKGTIMIKGVLYNISAWNRTSQNGRDYISLQAEEKPQDGSQGFQSRTSSQQRRQPETPVRDIPAPTIDDMPQVSDFEDLPF